MDRIQIGTTEIGEGLPAFIIAEAGVNHNGDLDLGKKLVRVAAEAGADAVKFQTFHAEDLVTASGERAAYQVKNTGKEESQQEMLQRLELSKTDFKELKKEAEERGILFLSTPHSGKRDVEILEELDIPAYKIGSGDLTNLPFLKYLAGKDKPIILSTGMATLEECQMATSTIKENGDPPLATLHCTTNYPCEQAHVNLKAMETLKKELDCMVGYSDHTEGIGVSILAVALGARVIEKHFTLDKKMVGPDHKASLDPAELTKVVNGIREVEKLKITSLEDAIPIIEKYGEQLSQEEGLEILGTGEKKPFPEELEIALVARKSIVARKAITAGTAITEDIITIKRPGTGISPTEYYTIMRKKTTQDIAADEVITWDMIK